MEDRNKDYIGAVFLIFLGIMFLLNTTGIIPWNMWIEIFKFWPIFLIFAGLKLIIPKSKIGNILLTILAFLIFAYIGATMYSSRNESNWGKFFRVPIKLINNDITFSKSIEIEEYQDIETINYDFKFGVSQFEITDSYEGYLDFKSKYSESHGEPELSSESVEKELNIKVKEKSSSVNFFNFNFDSPEYFLNINREIPSNISISNGVGQGTINLSNVNIGILDVSTGTGQMEILLSKNSIPSEEMSISTGTGEVELTIPSDVGYILKYSVGIGSITADSKEFSGIGKQDGEFKSSNYDEAQIKITIDVTTGVGSFNLNLINN